MTPTALRAAIGQLVDSLDQTTFTRLTEIVFDGKAMYIRTNHAGAPEASPRETAKDAVAEWLSAHDPDAGQRDKQDDENPR